MLKGLFYLLFAPIIIMFAIGKRVMLVAGAVASRGKR